MISYGIISVSFFLLPIILVLLLLKPIGNVVFFIIPVYFVQLIFPSFFVGSIGGINIFLLDIVFFQVLVFIIFRFYIMHDSPLQFFRRYGLISILICWIVLEMMRGTFSYGKKAFGDARLHFGFITVVFTILAVKDFRPIKKIIICFFACSSILFLIGFGRIFNFFPRGLHQETYRVLPAAAVLMLLWGVLILMTKWFRGNKVFLNSMEKVWFVLALFLIIFTQHRSVWLAAAISCIVILFQFKSFLKKYFPGILFFVSFVFLCIVVMIFLKARIAEYALVRMKAFYDPFNDQTAFFRLTAWRTQFQQVFDHPVIGSGFGNYYYWKFQGQVVSSQPHNAYFNLLLKTGIIGLLLYILFVMDILRRLVRAIFTAKDSSVQLMCKVLLVLIVSTQGFLFAYDMDFAIFFLYGISLAVATIISLNPQIELFK
jgi:O-antigen ligase